MHTHALVEVEVVWPHKSTIKSRKKTTNGLNLTHGFAPRRFGWPPPKDRKNSVPIENFSLSIHWMKIFQFQSWGRNFQSRSKFSFWIENFNPSYLVIRNQGPNFVQRCPSTMCTHIYKLIGSCLKTRLF